MDRPDFSPLAERYARSRPGYPPELYAYLASLVARRDVVWDCGAGNGQAAVDLAGHFDRVIATDISEEQIRRAMPHPRIDYRVAACEASGLDDDSVDLVTAAAAVHWFDIEAFFAEAERVLRPGGVLAVWTYHVGHVEAPFDDLFYRFYDEVLRPFFPPMAEVVNERYETLALPGVSVESDQPFFMRADWNLEQMKAFIMSWSGVQKYVEERGENPRDLMIEELQSLWGDPGKMHCVRWPLFLRASRVG